MSKERLEEIKKESKRLSGFGGKMDQEDINYLIQQAEKAQELEKIVNKAENHLLRNGNEIMKLTNDIAELKYQNQRYKEVLERALDYARSPKILTEPSGITKILDKALKGESNETSK